MAGELLDEQPASGSAPPDPAPPQPPQPPAPTPEPDVYGSFFDQIQARKRADLQTSLVAGAAKNPDQHAEAIRLADPVGLKPQAVADNLDTARTGQLLHSADPQRLVERHPELAHWLSDHDNAAIAHDDIDHLKAVHTAVQSATGDQEEPGVILPKGFVYASDGTIVEPLPGGLADVVGGPEQLRDLLQKRQQVAEVDAIDRQISADRARERFGAATPFVAGYVGSAVGRTFLNVRRLAGVQTESDDEQFNALQQASAQGTGVTGFLERQERIYGGLVGDAPLLFVGGAAAAEATSSLLHLGRISATLESALGAGGAARVAAGLETAAAFAPQSALSAADAAREHGAGAGALDFLVNTAVPGAFGGAFGARGLAKAIVPAEAAASDAELGLAQRALRATGFNAGMMATQTLANAIKDRTTGVDPDALRPERLGQALLDSAFFGGVTGAVFGLPSGKRNEMIQGSAEALQANTFATKLGLAIDALANSKANERAPERVAALLQDSVGAKVPHLFFDREGWDGFWKAQGENPAEVAHRSGAGDAYNEAAATGAPLRVPFATALQEMARADNWQQLALMARREPEATNAAEAKAFAEQAPDEIRRLAEEIRQQAEGAAKPDDVADPQDQVRQHIRDDIAAQLTAAKRPPEEVQTHSEVFSRLMTTLAQRMGVDPLEIHREAKLRIFGPSEADQARVEPGAPQEGTPSESLTVQGKRVVVADVPYGAGTSQDGSVVYIDRRIPRYLEIGGKRVDVHEAIARHELHEKPLMDAGKTYAEAHTEAQAHEHEHVAATHGIDRSIYEAAIKPFIDAAKAEARPEGIPVDLEQKPYQEQGEAHLIEGARAQPGTSAYEQAAFHGSPHEFDRFSLAKIGTGEGAQAFGWGLYFAGKKEIAQFYRNTLSKTGGTYDGKEGPDLLAAPDDHQAVVYTYVSRRDRGMSHDKAVAAFRATDALRLHPDSMKVVDSLRADKYKPPTAGRLYHVDIPEDDHYLLWDKPLSAQPETVKAALKRVAPEYFAPNWYDAGTGSVVERSALAKSRLTDEQKRANGFEYGIAADHNTGEDFYRRLSEQQANIPDDGNARVVLRAGGVIANGDRAASESLAKLGVAGIKYEDANSRGKDEKSHNYVIFDDKLVKVLAYEQRGASGPRGEFLPARLSGTGENIIRLMKGADRSTFLHESAHFLLEFMHDLSGRSDAPEPITADLGAIRDWLGAKDGEAISREQHEQFARGFERYLMEGKAPSLTLRRAFARIADWFKAIYTSIRGLNVEISPEIRGVFDRMLATDGEIAEAERQAKSAPLFDSPEAAGMTPAEFAKYQQASEDAHREHVENLRRELMQSLRQDDDAKIQEERRALREQQDQVVAGTKLYQAIDALQGGKVPEGFDLEPGQVFKLNRQDLVDRYGDQILKQLPGPREGGQERPNSGRRVYTNDGGMSLDEAANVLRYPTGDDLVQALLHAEDRDALVDRLTDQEMQNRHPDPMRDGSLAEKAMEAVFSGKQADLIQRELEALRKQEGAPAPAPSVEVMRAAAERTIANTRAGDLRPEGYRAAAKKAAGEAAEALAKKDYRAAAEAKQRELLSHELYREAARVQRATRDAIAYLRRFNRADVRGRITKAGGGEWMVSRPDGTTEIVDSEEAAKREVGKDYGASYGRVDTYLQQIDALLGRLDLGNVSSARDQNRESLNRWIARQVADGKSVVIPEWLRDEALRTNWKNLTTEQLTGLKSSVANIAHLAEMAHDLAALGAARSKAELVGQMLETQSTNRKPPRSPNVSTTFADEVSGKGRTIGLGLTKLSFILREMDGGKMGGPNWKAIGNPLNKAESAEIEIRREGARLEMEARKAWGKELGPKNFSSPFTPKFDPVLGTKISLADKIGVLLNWGTAKNRERILTGHGWTVDQVRHIIDSLDEQDVAFARSLWKTVGRHRSPLQALTERLSGVTPTFEEGLPIQTRFGQIEGGYWPIKYDGNQSVRLGEGRYSTDGNGGFQGVSTRSGFLEERVSSTGRKVLLDPFQVLHRHESEVAHFLSHEEIVQDIGKLMRDRGVYESIANNFGVDTYRTIRNTVLDVARGDYRPSDERFIAGARRNLTLFRQGYNTMTSLLTLTGVNQSMTRIRPDYFLRGLQDLLPGDLSRTAAAVKEGEALSTLLRSRDQTFLREVREPIAKMPTHVLTAPVTRFAYHLLRWSQKIIDHIVWRAAFRQEMDRNPHLSVQELADIADQQVIDTQSSGSVKDLPAIMRGGEAKKLLTMFYTWQSSRFNLTREAFRSTDFTDPKSVALMASRMLILHSLPIAIEEAIRRGVRSMSGASSSQEDREGWVAWLAKHHLAQFMSTIPVLREFQAAVLGHHYAGPAATGLFTEGDQMVRQVGKAVETGSTAPIKAKVVEDLIGMGLGLPISPLEKATAGAEYAEQHNANPIAPMVFGPPSRK